MIRIRCDDINTQKRFNITMAELQLHETSLSTKKFIAENNLLELWQEQIDNILHHILWNWEFI